MNNGGLEELDKRVKEVKKRGKRKVWCKETGFIGEHRRGGQRRGTAAAAYYVTLTN